MEKIKDKQKANKRNIPFKNKSFHPPCIEIRGNKLHNEKNMRKGIRFVTISIKMQ